MKYLLYAALTALGFVILILNILIIWSESSADIVVLTCLNFACLFLFKILLDMELEI
jgi:hypothetical protein